jgi:hypothetical protein
MRNKKIIAIDLVLVVGSLLIIGGLVGYAQPLAIAPINDLETTETGVLFEFEKANVILIDDNLEFSSPQEIYVQDNLVVNLKPGVYYWKVKGVLSSEVKKLTIESEVDLKLRELEEKYEIVNSGNTKLNVDIYGELDGSLIGNVILDVDEDEEVSGTSFIGGEYGE